MKYLRKFEEVDNDKRQSLYGPAASDYQKKIYDWLVEHDLKEVDVNVEMDITTLLNPERGWDKEEKAHIRVFSVKIDDTPYGKNSGNLIMLNLIIHNITSGWKSEKFELRPLATPGPNMILVLQKIINYLENEYTPKAE